MNKFFIVVLIGLMMAVGLVLVGCGGVCPGSGNCTVTIKQDAYGLSVDNNSPRSTCGKSSTWNSDYSSKSGGCLVQDNIDNYNRRYGTQSCNCAAGLF